MTKTTTHNEHDTTTERTLFVAFELREKTWKLGCTIGHGQKPRERTVAARHQARLLQRSLRPKSASVCLQPHRWCVVMKPGVKASGCTAFYRPRG